MAWGDNLSGQTNVPVDLANVTAIRAGGFHSLVLIGRSAPILTITNVPHYEQGRIRFEVPGWPSDVCRVLVSSNLLNWQELGTITNYNGIAQFTDPDSTNYSQRFYRLSMP